MGHHAGHLTFSARSFDHSAVDVHWTTGKRERIDVSRIDDFEVVLKSGMLKLRRDTADQPLVLRAQHNFALHDRAARETALSLLRSLTSELDVVLNTVFVTVIV